MPTQDPSIIEALAKNEEKLSKLYQEYAATYKDYQVFWSTLSEEELTHALWLRSLEESYRKGALPVNEKFHIETVKLFDDYLEERLVDFKVEKFGMNRALVVSLDIENSLIDKSWFKMFEPIEVKDKLIIHQLISALEIHRDRVTKMIIEYQSK